MNAPDALILQVNPAEIPGIRGNPAFYPRPSGTQVSFLFFPFLFSFGEKL